MGRKLNDEERKIGEKGSVRMQEATGRAEREGMVLSEASSEINWRL